MGMLRYFLSFLIVQYLILQLIYHYKLKLTTDDRFETAAREVCKEQISVSDTLYFTNKIMKTFNPPPCELLIYNAHLSVLCLDSQGGQPLLWCCERRIFAMFDGTIVLCRSGW